jgi:hypothetical protein
MDGVGVSVVDGVGGHEADARVAVFAVLCRCSGYADLGS